MTAANGDRLSAQQVRAAVLTLDPGWSGDTASLARTVHFPSFPDAIEFIAKLGPIAEALDHHPDLSLSWRTVVLTLTTHASDGVTGLDIDLAARLDALATELEGSTEFECT